MPIQVGIIYLLLLVLSIPPSHAITPTPIHIDCCTLWESMNVYVTMEKGSTYMCGTSEECMKKSQVKLLVNEMQTYMNLSTTATDVVVKVDSSKSKEMADMLVMAMVARFIPKKQEESDEHPFLEYNEATHVLRLRTPLCEFQKDLYVSIIVISITILIFVLVRQNVENTDEQEGVEKSASHFESAPLLAPASQFRSRHVDAAGAEQVVPVWSGMRFRM